MKKMFVFILGLLCLVSVFANGSDKKKSSIHLDRIHHLSPQKRSFDNEKSTYFRISVTLSCGVQTSFSCDGCSIATVIAIVYALDTVYCPVP